MKNQFVRLAKASTIACSLLLMSQVTWATEGQRTTTQTQRTVEKAAPDDWYLLAKAAQRCFKRGENLKLAVSWLNKSILIKRAPYNLEIRGDYYAANQLPRKALEAYAESYRIGFLTNMDYRGSDICEKMAERWSNWPGPIMEIFNPFPWPLPQLASGLTCAGQLVTGGRRG